MNAIVRPSTGIVEYESFVAGLAELQERYKGIVFEVTTAQGDKAARAARMELSKLRTAIEKRRVELKAPALERSRLIDSVAKQITSEILAIEAPIDAQIKAQEEAKEAERQARAKAEADRIAAIQTRINRIRHAPAAMANVSSKDIRAYITRIENYPIGPEFGEFQTEAKVALVATLESLTKLAEGAERLEAEQARLIADRAELDRLRAEQEAREAVERAKIEAERKAEADRIAAERAELEKVRKAEADAIAVQRKAEADKIASERRAFEAQQEAARIERAEREAMIKADQQAEQQRLNAERAELKRQQDAEAERQAAAVAAQQRAEQLAATRLCDAAPDLLVACVALIETWGTQDELAHAALLQGQNAVTKATLEQGR